MTNKSTKWRNRIKEYEQVSPQELIKNPLNFRIHTQMQRDQMETVLSGVGWVDAVKVNKTTGHIVDGHLRVEDAILNNEKTVPVLWLELTEAEEKAVLASFDWITSLAKTDDVILTALLREVDSEDVFPDDSVLIDMIANDAGIYAPNFESVDESSQPRLDQKAPTVCPECGHAF